MVLIILLSFHLTAYLTFFPFNLFWIKDITTPWIIEATCTKVFFKSKLRTAAWIRHIKHEPPKSFMFLETSLSDEHLLLHHQAPSACTQYSPLLAPPPLLSVCPRHWLAVRELPASPSPPPAACGWCGPRATGCRPLRRWAAGWSAASEPRASTSSPAQDVSAVWCWTSNNHTPTLPGQSSS